MKKALILLFFVVVLVFVTPTPTLAQTDTGPVPGSFWYGITTTFENVNLFFTFNAEKKAEKALNYAERHLTQAKTAVENENTSATEIALTDYEEKLKLATKSSKKIEDSERAEKLLTIIADNTERHQETLSEVLEKVPEEAREAIAKAMEASKRGQEEATQKIAELKGEVERLKQEVAELKQNNKDEQIVEIEKLKKEVEELKTENKNKNQKETTSRVEIENSAIQPKKAVPQTKTAPTQKTENTQSQITPKTETPKITTVTLPNGAVMEMDENWNIIRTIKEAPQQTYIKPVPTNQNQTTQVNTEEIKITSINITPNITSVKIEWQTDKPTESKVFLSGGDFSSKVYNSESGLSTRHSVSVSGLKGDTNYSYEIEVISGGIAFKKTGSLSTKSGAKIDLGFSLNNSSPILATGWTQKDVYALVYGDNGEKLSNVRINIITPDESQNKIIDYANIGTQNSIQGAFWFGYYPKFVGTHTITFSVPLYGLTKSVNIEATPYVREIPRIKFSQNFSLPMSINTEGGQIAKIVVNDFNDGDEYYIKDFSYEIISDTLTEQDIDLSLWDGGSLLDLNNPFKGNFIKGISKDLTVKADNISKVGKFKLSISAKVFSVNENKEFILSNLPLVTSEVEIK